MKPIHSINTKLNLGLFSLSLVVLSVLIQELYSLEPCPLCITQRVIFMISGVTFIFLHFRPVNRIFDFILLASINLSGLIFALRHVLIQRKIIEIPAECGIDLDYMFDNFPLKEAFELIFRGTGDCSEIDWKLLGISIPEWSMIWFFVFILMIVITFNSSRKKF